MLIFGLCISMSALFIFGVSTLFMKKLSTNILVGLLIIFIIGLCCIKTYFVAEYSEHYNKYNIQFIDHSTYLVIKKSCRRKPYNFATCHMVSSKTISGKDLDLFYKTVRE